MRIRKISNNKIVVALSDSDLAHYEINFEANPPQAADLHKFLFDVMELVKSETGFDPYSGGQVVVEASPSEDGLSLIISKIRADKNAMTREKFNKVKRITAKKSTSDSLQKDFQSIIGKMNMAENSKKGTGNTIFVFDCFCELEEALTMAFPDDFSGIALYRNQERYALVTKCLPGDREYNIMSEYANLSTDNWVTAYDIAEGWNTVAQNDDLVAMVRQMQDML